MAMGGRLSYFEQLSTREKLLLAGVSVFAVLVVIGGASFFISSALGEIEDEIEVNRDLIGDIEVAAEEYVRVKSQCQALRNTVATNPIVSLRIPVNNIARGVNLDGGKKLSDEIGSLEKQVETELGAICEKRDPKKKKKKKDEEVGEVVVRVEQDFEFRNIPIAAVYELLEGLEKSEDLLFVTELEVRRKFGEPDAAQNAKVTVATYRLQGAQ
jgi:hypothetical protein